MKNFAMKAAICSNQGYDKLERADILSRARKIEDGLSILLLYRSIWEGLPEDHSAVPRWSRN